MKKTNITNPVRAMMKPLPAVDTKSGIKAEQEAALMRYLDHKQQSVYFRDAFVEIEDFPGCGQSSDQSWIDYNNVSYRKRRAIINTFKRLESKGQIISTLFRGCRYYSIPVEKGGEN